MQASGLWAGRCGAPTGAQHQLRHHRDGESKTAFGSSAGGGFYIGAAGRATGARIEVVHRNKSSPFEVPAPYANTSAAWRRATSHHAELRNVPTAQKLLGMQVNDVPLFDPMRHSASIRASSLGTTLRSGGTGTLNL